MLRLLFLIKIAALTMVVFILLSNLRPALTTLANLVIAIPSPIQGF
jgi:hypothetical protein